MLGKSTASSIRVNCISVDKPIAEVKFVEYNPPTQLPFP